ncbi:MAG: ABC transporter substrate-binding protein, partial [Termitinemataceae bacterium]
MMKRNTSRLWILGCFFLSFLIGSCSPRPIKVGFIGGLSGFNSDLGIAGRNGATLAIEAINTSGGIRGKKLQLIVKDDQQNPETAQRVFKE